VSVQGALIEERGTPPTSSGLLFRPDLATRKSAQSHRCALLQSFWVSLLWSCKNYIFLSFFLARAHRHLGHKTCSSCGRHPLTTKLTRPIQQPPYISLNPGNLFFPLTRDLNYRDRRTICSRSTTIFYQDLLSIYR